MTTVKRKSRIIEEMQETLAGLNKSGVISKRRMLEVMSCSVSESVSRFISDALQDDAVTDVLRDDAIIDTQAALSPSTQKRLYQ